MPNSVIYYYFYIYLGRKEETIVLLKSPYFYLTAAARILMTRDNELRKLIEKKRSKARIRDAKAIQLHLSKNRRVLFMLYL